MEGFAVHLVNVLGTHVVPVIQRLVAVPVVNQMKPVIRRTTVVKKRNVINVSHVKSVRMGNVSQIIQRITKRFLMIVMCVGMER